MKVGLDEVVEVRAEEEDASIDRGLPKLKPDPVVSLFPDNAPKLIDDEDDENDADPLSNLKAVSDAAVEETAPNLNDVFTDGKIRVGCEASSLGLLALLLPGLSVEQHTQLALSASLLTRHVSQVHFPLDEANDVNGIV